MAKLHSKTMAIYFINGRRIALDLNWKGRNPIDDSDRFYDLFDADTGEHLNEDGPWHDDGDGVPSYKEVKEYMDIL